MHRWIKHLIFAFLALTMGQSLWAAQSAMVKVDKAIVYADREMTTPIGHIIMGKKIRVGKVPRNRGQILPISVSGKVAWIKIQDLYLEEDLELLKTRKFNRHEELIEELERSRYHYKRKSISATYGWFQAGRDWKATSTVVNNGEEQSFGQMVDARFGFPLNFTDGQSLRFGGNYVQINDREMYFQAWGVASDWSLLLGEFEKLSAEFNLTGIIYPYPEWRILADKLKGQAIGFKALLDTTYYITNNFGFKFDFGYTWIHLFGFSLSGGTNIEDANLSGDIAGAHLNLGLIGRF